MGPGPRDPQPLRLAEGGKSFRPNVPCGGLSGCAREQTKWAADWFWELS